MQQARGAQQLGKEVEQAPRPWGHALRQLLWLVPARRALWLQSCMQKACSIQCTADSYICARTCSTTLLYARVTPGATGTRYSVVRSVRPLSCVYSVLQGEKGVI